MFKEIENMKALRYLLISIAILSAVSISAQESTDNWGKLPDAKMHSTSVMQGSGSTLPMAATDGVTTTTSSSPAKVSGPRRALDDGDDDIDPQGQPFPLGDALFPLMIAAAVYGVWCISVGNAR